MCGSVQIVSDVAIIGQILWYRAPRVTEEVDEEEVRILQPLT